MKESIKESAFGRRQELPAGTGAAPLCQPMKCGADYRDVTATLKMKHSRRLCGERFTLLAVDMAFRRRRRREHGFGRTLTLHPYQKAYSIKMSASFTTLFFTFFYFEEIKERISQGCEGFSPRKLRRLRWFLLKYKQNSILSSFLTARSRGVSPNSAFSYFLSAEA